MATLEGSTISSTYKDLLQVDNGNSGVDGTLRDVEDGEGTASKLQLSTDGVKSTGTLEVTGDTTLTGELSIGGVTLTATGTELNYSDGVTSAIQTQMDLKAPLASPTLTGTPAAPTAVEGTDTTQIATTAFVKSAVEDETHLALGTTSSTALAGDTTTISSGQASAITANTAKTGITSGQASAITANTAKTGITSGQASAITANTAKTGITSGQASAITANTAKTTNATHTGEVTGSGALTIADDVIREVNLEVNAPTNDHILTADSAADGGMKWAAASGGGTLTTKGDLESYTTTQARLAVGIDDYVLTADASAAAGVAWKVASGGTTAYYVENFNGNGSTVAFTLTQTPADVKNTQVYISGVYQQKDTYEVEGATLTFSEAPSTGTDNIEVVIAPTAAIGTTSTDLVTFTPDGTGATDRTTQAKLRDTVSVKDFGATGNGTDDDTDAIIAALAAATAGGSVYFPAGTYKFLRGTGSLLSDTIVASDLTIYGDGAASVLDTYKGDGTRPDSTGSELYNVFQGTSTNNVTIRDIKLQGYCSLAHFITSSNIVIERVYIDGNIGNPSNYLLNKGVYFNNCTNIRVSNSTFMDVFFGVYFGGANLTRTKECIVINNHFEHTNARGDCTASFPVGVYVYYADDIIVNSNTFKNIHSSVDDGSTGTGMGYGIYEGDGAASSLVIDANQFIVDGNGGGHMIPIYINEAMKSAVSNNIITTTDGEYTGIRICLQNEFAHSSVVGNSITMGEGVGENIKATFEAANCGITISNNYCVSGAGCIAVYNTASGTGADVNIDNNVVSDSANTYFGIKVQGTAGTPIIRPKLTNNVVKNCQGSGIRLASYIIQAYIVGNKIIDCDQGDDGGEEKSSGIRFTSYAYGSHLADNFIGNTLAGTGNLVYGVSNASNSSDRIFKDTGTGNFFENIDNALVGNLFKRFYTQAAPTGGVYDLQLGDFIKASYISGGEPVGYYCTHIKVPTLASDASSASTTIEVDSTTGMAVGDLVLLLKDSATVTEDYYVATEYHMTTIGSITDGTNFVISDAIPAGDGTYSTGTAYIKTARIVSGFTVAS